MPLNWSKVLVALQQSPGCVDEGQHNKFIELVLTPNILLRSDAFYYDNNTGMEDVWMEDTKLSHYSELHKYAQMQSKFWWNKWDNTDCPIIDNAKEVVMKDYSYMTSEICDRLDKTNKFYNYR